ncbi:MAG: hypothetical protein ACI8UX_002173 [Psychromonas sp.]|jgi:hypothetical protein
MYNWIERFVTQRKLVATHALRGVDKTVKDKDMATSGPHSAIKEIVGGYIEVNPGHFEYVVSLSEGYPTLSHWCSEFKKYDGKYSKISFEPFYSFTLFV